MANQEQQPQNLFAQELMWILASRGLSLEQLAEMVEISPDKLQRLQKSLYNPTFSPLLNPDEMEQLVTTLHINTKEQKRLQAAILVTAVQRLLKGQLHPADVQQITRQLHPSLLYGLAQTDLDLLGDGIRISDHDAREDVKTELHWTPVLNALDAADLALQLSCGPVLYAERVRKIKEACIYLEEALAELERMDDVIKALPIWRARYQKASSDYQDVIKHLQALGEKIVGSLAPDQNYLR